MFCFLKSRMAAKLDANKRKRQVPVSDEVEPVYDNLPPFQETIIPRKKSAFSAIEVSLLKRNLKEIDTTIASVRDDMAEAEERLTALCEFIRGDIVVCAESAIEAINQNCTELLKRVDAYEVECQRSLPLSDNVKADMELALAEHAQFTAKWSEYSTHRKSFQLSTVAAASAQSEERKWQLKKQRRQLRAKIFGSRQMRAFVPKEDFSRDLIGELRFTDNYFPTNMRAMERVQLRVANCDKPLKCHAFARMKNGHHCAVFWAAGGPGYQIGIFNSAGRQVVSKTINSSSSHMLAYSSDSIVHASLVYTGIQGYKTNLVILNSELAEITRSSTLNKALCVQATSSRIICLESDKSPQIAIYDWQLNLLQRFGQSLDDTLPFYVNINARYLQECRSQLVLTTNRGEVNILDEMSGLAISSFQVFRGGIQPIISEDDELIFYEADGAVFYNLNGQVTRQMALQGFSEFSYTGDLRLSVYPDDEFIIYSQKRGCFYRAK